MATTTRFHLVAGTLLAAAGLGAVGFVPGPGADAARRGAAPVVADSAYEAPDLPRDGAGAEVADTVPADASAPAEAPAEPAVLEVQTGSASFYANSLAGRRTASGVPYRPRELVAAHRQLPFGTVLRVTSLTNDRSVEVRVVDRGPFAKGRVLDLSRRAAEELDMIRRGHMPVKIEVLSYGS